GIFTVESLSCSDMTKPSSSCVEVMVCCNIGSSVMAEGFNLTSAYGDLPHACWSGMDMELQPSTTWVGPSSIPMSLSVRVSYIQTRPQPSLLVRPVSRGERE